MKIAVEKNHLGGQILYTSLDPFKKRRLRRFFQIPKFRSQIINYRKRYRKTCFRRFAGNLKLARKKSDDVTGPFSQFYSKCSAPIGEVNRTAGKESRKNGNWSKNRKNFGRSRTRTRTRKYRRTREIERNYSKTPFF